MQVSILILELKVQSAVRANFALVAEPWADMKQV
jgi:hypothetical protein